VSEFDRILARLRAPREAARRGSPLSPAERALLAERPSPADRPRGDHDLNPDFYEPGRRSTQAAVLVPLVKRLEGPTILLTKRTDHLRDHAGQISFPGGRIEKEDAHPEAAALRETEEEIGLHPRHIELVGRLDTYLTRTGFEVTPVVGLVTPPFDLTLDSFEVAEAFEVPLGFFLDQQNRKMHSRVWQGRERYFYVYPYLDYFIWGATAGMLSNLAEILAEPEE
jgi:8-oxo-dGTP pyrophosphatase MutT (NUDIX family)